jgi:hypothetical protein
MNENVIRGRNYSYELGNGRRPELVVLVSVGTRMYFSSFMLNIK